ncbi:hypothetical protein Lalb_Chr15g0076681 [Lupinus albus]|uniref:Uncharacterized protein n=1 Tax=Lupinus albus TaxID=3870 RepID=A0A6A4PAY8_LUPAL|nr:hypothetical protein Lalb_Chr15g0076681 [Lupinus albus]
MKGWSIALAATFALTLLLLLSTCSTTIAKAEIQPSTEKVHSLPLTKSSSSHQKAKKCPSKQVGSSFRRIPPTKSNPTHNK